MEKKIKIKLKKIFAIFLTVVLLQNYGFILENVVIATEKELFDFTTSGNSDYMEMVKDKQNNTENSAESSPSEEETNVNDQEEISENVEEQTPERESENSNSEQLEQLPEQVFSSVITSENASMYKGYLYANIVSGKKYETMYTYTETVEIQHANFIDEIIFEEDGDKFVLGNSRELNINNNCYYKQIIISEEEFNEILGNEGYIEFYTKDDEFIGRMNNKSKKVDGVYVFNFDVEIHEMNTKICNPIQNGTLSLKTIKAIKSDLPYTRRQVEQLRNIKTQIKAKAIYKQEYTWEIEPMTNVINLEETESRMDLDLNTTEFSTMLENQVTFHVTLKTNEERFDLFQNPTIEIMMPSAIQKVEITSVNLLYKNALSLTNWEVSQNEAGKKVIRVSMQGTQTEYTPGSMQEGTTLVIYTKINVDKLTSNIDEKIKMTYTNQNSSKLYYNVNGKEAEEVDIKFVSKEGILKSNSILNYNSTLEGIYGFNDEILVGQLEVGGDRKTATVNMAIVNNYAKELNNVSIIGRIPTEGSVDANGNSLGTTINTLLLNPIAYSGVSSKIYYSYKTNAGIEDESWTETVADYGLIKSYKIVLDAPMKQGDRVEFSYNILIPENLNYNESMFNTYQVNYYIDNQLISEISSIGAQTPKREIVLEDCTEQVEQEVVTEKPEEAKPEVKPENITVGMKVTKGGVEVGQEEEIFERQILRYTVILKNTTSKTLNNVKLKGKAKNANLYYLKEEEMDNDGETVHYKIPVEDDGTKDLEEIVAEQLKPNETLKLEYQVIVKEIPEDAEEFVWGEVYLVADGIEEAKIETAKNKIKQAKVALRAELGATETMDDTDLQTEHSIKYCIKAQNLTDTELKNIELNIFIPEILEYDPESFVFGYDELTRYVTPVANGKKITFEIPNIAAKEEMELYLIMNVSSMELEKEKEEVVVYANTEIEGENYISNDYLKTVWQSKANIEYEFYSNLENNSEVKSGDEIIYTLKVRNTGRLQARINTLNTFPDGLNIENISLKTEEKIIALEKENGGIDLPQELESNKEIEINIETKSDKSLYLEDQEYIECYFEIYGNNINSVTTNVISLKITDNKKKENEENLEEDKENFYTDEELKEFEEIKKKEEESSKYPEDQEDTKDPNEEVPGDDHIDNDQDPTDEPNNNQDENNDPDLDNEPNDSDYDNNSSNNNNNNNNTNPEENDTPNNEPKGKYYIRGKAWLDSNKNGKYDSEEEKLANIPVRLYKSTNGTSVVYSATNLVARTQTDSDGNYEFDNLENGYYLVMFEYDEEIYGVTQYKSEYAGESSNSDCITKTATIDGDRKTVAISDIVTIDSSNIGSIDLGLIQIDECDIEIRKSIASITVEDDKGTQTIEYNEDEIAKLEIAAKKLNQTKLTILYEFEIQNNGDIDTYVTNLVDYLPEGFEFNDKNNSGWYLGEDNNLYNLSLVNTKIEPGKTKTLKLALTKQMTEDSLGSYVNKTEVLETTNDRQLSEITLGNNQSEVELLIAVKTGKVMIYTSIIVLIIGIGTTFIILVKKKKINLKPVYK